MIPGTVGASPIQNIGAYGVEVGEFIESVTFFEIDSGAFNTLPKEACEFGYRDSIFKNALLGKVIITEVKFRVPKKWNPVVTYGELKNLSNPSAEQVFNKVIEIRQSKLPDPDILGNSGSFFKNPIVDQAQLDLLLESYPDVPVYPLEDGLFKLAAGWLIEQAGLKGKEFDGVAVHDKQALVLVNKSGEAKGQSLLIAIETVIATVKRKYSINLEPEVRIYGHLGESLTRFKLDNQHV